MSGHRFTVQHCTIININAPKKKKIQTTEFQKYEYT